MSEENRQLETQDTGIESSPVANAVDQSESLDVETVTVNANSDAADAGGIESESSIGGEDGANATEHTEEVGTDSPTEASSDTADEFVQEAATGVDSSDVSEEVTVPQLEQLEAELEVLRGQLEERTSQYMRIAADFENFRKRTAKEKKDLELRVKRDTLTELLPVVDSFERARSQIKPQTDQEDAIQKSYQSVFKQFVDCLKRIGVSPMRAKGVPFNPEHHEAVMREPTDEYEEGVVIEELVKGYMLGEQVLRHSMVKVATPPEPVLASEGNHPDQPENSMVD